MRLAGDRDGFQRCHKGSSTFSANPIHSIVKSPLETEGFAGITFEIVNSSANAVVVDRTPYTPGQVVATLTTDVNGHASTADNALSYGRYTVREKATNNSMLLTWREQLVTVSENRKIYSVTAVDDVVRGGLAVEKRDSITGSTPQGDADFEGITFEVINNSKNPVIVNDKSIAPGEVALTLTSDSEGKCHTADNALPFGEYILHEKSTNDSMLNTAPDQTVIIDEHLKVYTHQMDNEVVRGGVLIEKRDLESKLLTPLGGASLEVFVHADINDKNQTITIRGRGGLVIRKTAEDNFVEGVSFLITGKDYAKKFKTNEDGEIHVDNLAPGEYTVTEIADKVTARYEIQEGQTVTVTAGEQAEVKFHNKLLRGQIVGRKTDTEGNPLEGVNFGLFTKDAKEFSKDKAIATSKTDRAGKFEFKDVPYGEYQIKELEALPGYIMLAGTVPVKVDSSTVTLEDIQNAKTQIVVSKIDSATGKELPGAKLEIRDKDGKVVESWTSTDKPHTIEKLPAGEYTLHEVSAPKGYELAEDIKFTVKDSGEPITIVMKDKPSGSVETPQTGDRGWPLALAVFGVSLGGVVISMVLGRKKKKDGGI